MDIWLIMYLADTSAKLLGLSIMASVLFGVVSFAIVLFSTLESEPQHLSKLKFTGPMLAFFILVSIIVPSKQVVYAYAAEKAAIKIAQDPDFKRIGEKVLKVIEAKLDEATK